MLRNTDRSWGWPARTLHWLMAAMLLVQVPLGFRMNAVYAELLATKATDWSSLLALSRAHHTLGFLILILAVARLGWRAANPTPGLPAGLAAYQRFLARVTHAFLYGLLFVFPLSGWATLSVYEGEFPIFFFGIDSMPRLLPQADTNEPYMFYAAIHKACWRAGGVLLGLHVVAALWHQWVVRDGVLTRMWRG
ncbi:MAG: cytochrome b [Chromatiales bacterium]|nr:cytochrome b [Chromatiales bacterium]